MPPTFPRRPVRISITVSQIVHELLLERSDAQGRSHSNLSACLLEAALLQREAALLQRMGREGSGGLAA